MATLYESFQIGDLVVPNRIVMAPLTRSRANEQREPTDLAVTYYHPEGHSRTHHHRGQPGLPRGPGLCLNARHLLGRTDCRMAPGD